MHKPSRTFSAALCAALCALAVRCSGGSDTKDEGFDGGGDAAAQDETPDATGETVTPDSALEAGDAGGQQGDSAADGSSDVLEELAEVGLPEAAHDADMDDSGWDGGDHDGGAGDGGEAILSESICYFGDFDVDALHEVACLSWPGPVRTMIDLQGLTGGYEVDWITRSTDGRSMAVAGRKSATAPVNLVVYRLDGTGAPLVVATAPSKDRVIQRPSFSADGSTLAFLADFELAGAMSLYLVSTTAGAPKRVSPAPTHPDLDVLDYAWSRGAKTRSWLAYAGDLEQDGVVALWTLDVSNVPPAPIAVLPTTSLAPDRDVQTGLQWDGAGRLYFRTNVIDPGKWRVHWTNTDGTDQGALPDLVTANGVASTFAFGVAHAGDRLAFSAEGDAPGILQVYVTDLKAPSPSTVTVSSSSMTAQDGGVLGPALGQPIRWSAGDSMLACAADWAVTPADRPDVFSAWVLGSAQGGQDSRVLGAPQSVDRNVREVAFSRTGSRLFVRGDVLSDGVFELFSTDDLTTAGQDPVAARVEEVPPGGDVLGLEWIP
jgi:hypothetical protein